MVDKIYAEEVNPSRNDPLQEKIEAGLERIEKSGK